jgi:uncharacterized Zn finger protein
VSRKHGATWWSGRFLRSLERLGMTTRLRRGHAYFEQGRVTDIEVKAGVVKSLVRGSEEYQCCLFFEPLSNMEWNESLDRLAFDDLSAAALLTAGRMPPQIEDFFIPSGRRLLPQAESDIELNCTCGDRSVPCKHLSATAYALAEKLDLDPWLLFLLRGHSADEVERALVARWNRDVAEERSSKESAASPQDSEIDCHEFNVDLFWANHLQTPILFPHSVKSATGLTLERMSVPEPKIEAGSWNKVFSEIYRQVTERANELSV